MSWRRKLLVAAVVLVTLALLTAVVLRSNWFQTQILSSIQSTLESDYGVRLEVHSFDYTLSQGIHIVLEDVQAFEKSTKVPFFKAARLEIDAPYSILWSSQKIVDRIFVRAPALDLDRLPRFATSDTAEASVQVRNIRIESGALNLQQREAQDIQLSMSLDQQTLYVKDAAAKYEGVVLHARGSVQLERMQFDLTYQAEGDLNAISRIIPEAPQVSGPVQATGTLSGKSSDLRLDANFSSPGFHVTGAGPVAMNGTARYEFASDNPLRLEVAWQHLPMSIPARILPEIPEIHSLSDGKLQYAGGLDVWQGTGSFKATLAPQKGPLPLGGEFSGALSNGALDVSRSRLTLRSVEAHLSGSLSSNRMDLVLHANAGDLRDLSVLVPELRRVRASANLDGTLHGNFNALEFEGKSNLSTQSSSLQVEGKYDLQKEVVEARFQGNTGGDDWRLIGLPDVSGELNFSGEASGKSANPTIHAIVSSGNLAVQNVAMGSIAGSIESDGKILRADFQLSDLKTSMSGEYAWRTSLFNLHSSFQDLPLELLGSWIPEGMKDFGGTVSGNLELSGNAKQWRNADARLEISNADLKHAGWKMETVAAGEIRMKGQSIDVNMQLQSAQGEAKISGQIPLDDRTMMDLNVTADLDVSKLPVLVSGYEFSGNANAQIHVGGAKDSPQFSGTVKLNAFNASSKDQKWKLENVNGTVELQQETLKASLQGMMSGAALELQASIPMQKSPGTVALSVRALQIAALVPGTNVSGLVDINLSATGQGTKPADWNGSASFQFSNLKAGTDSISIAEPILVNLEQGVATIPQFRLNAAGLLDMVAGGTYRLKDGAVEAEVQARADLSLVSQVLTDVQGNGPVDGVVKVTGTLQAPVWNGYLRAENVFLRSQVYPLILENASFEAPFDEHGLHLKVFHARMGGGTVEAKGEILLEKQKPAALSFEITGRNVGLNYPEGLRSQIDTDLKWNGSFESSELVGNVRVLRSLYNADIDYRDRLTNTLLSQQADLSGSSTAAGRVKLNLQVQTVQDFRLRNNLARLRSGGDLNITGTAAQPRVSGQVQVREGSVVYFEGNNFVVEKAVLSFFGTSELNPSFDATLSTTVNVKVNQTTRQDYLITLRLRGPLDNLVPKLTSDPSDLNDSQIYSALLTGDLQELRGTGLGGLIFQRQLVSFLSGHLFFDFQKRIAGALGFSQFEIQPNLMEDDPAVRLIVAKELASGFEVQYSTLLSQHTDSTYIATYRFKNKFNLRFVDQDDGSYTGGLQHSLSFGGGPSAGRTSPRTPRIASLEIVNESVLDAQTIREKLAVREGQKYDPWKLEDYADDLKKSMQQRGYLFPVVEISEKLEADANLRVRVDDGAIGRMEFSGMEVSGESIELYEQWWREGLSEAVVLSQIADNLQAQLFEKGHHRAVVRTSQEKAGESIEYEFQADPGTLFAEIEVVFTGNSSYSQGELEREMLSLYESQEEMLQAAVHRFPSYKENVTALYVRRGFLDVHVESAGLRFTENSVHRDVRVEEGKPYTIDTVEVSDGSSFPEELLGRLKIVPGAIYESQPFSEDEVTVMEYYQDRGYWKTQVSAQVRKENEGSLVAAYDLKTGEIARIRSVRISGNRRTKDSLILRRISISPGDVLTRTLLMQVQNQIEVTQLFRQVNVQARETETPDLYDIEIEIVESEPYDFTYGLRYDSEQDVEGEVELQDSNLFGRGQNVRFYGRWSSTNTLYRFLFHTAPNAVRRETLATLPWRTLLTLDYESRESPEFLSKLTSVNFQRRWEFLEPLVFLTNYKFEQGRTTSTDSGGEVVFDLKQNVSRLIGVVVLDLRNDAFNPTSGLLVTNEVEYAPDFLKSDLVFTKNYSQYFQYFRFGSFVSASALRFGVGWDLIGSERFLAGGQTTIRGFELDEVGPHSRFTGLPTGGESVLIINQEFRFPLYSWMGGVVFYDGGNVYPTVSDFSFSDIRNTAGFGLRLNSPYGVARFDIGFNLSPEDDESSYVLHFGLGQAW